LLEVSHPRIGQLTRTGLSAQTPVDERYGDITAAKEGTELTRERSEGDSSDSHFHTAELWTVELKFHCFRPDVTSAQLSVAFFPSLNVVSVLKRKSDVTHHLDEDK
jgi:hypothetical protein